MNKGDWVTWTYRDQRGTLRSLTGKVTSAGTSGVNFRSDGGQPGFPRGKTVGPVPYSAIKLSTSPFAPHNKKNPQAQITRGKWINGKIRVTKSGKIEAMVPRSAVKNPAHRTGKFKGGFTGLKSMMTRRRTKAQAGSAFGTDKNKRYLVGVSGSTSSYTYASKVETAKKKGIAIARKFGQSKFFVQNQVTGSIINFEVR